MILNMNPFDNEPTEHPFLGYTIGISGQEHSIDQKRKSIKLLPGKHTSIKVSVHVVDSSEEFNAFEVKDRKCKLSHETEGFR